MNGQYPRTKGCSMGTAAAGWCRCMLRRLRLLCEGTASRTPTCVLVAALLAFGTTPAFGGSFTDIGVVYSLSSVFVSGTSTTQTFNVTLTVNDKGYSGPNPGSDLLDAVAVKVDNDGNIINEKMLSGPPNWTFVDGGTSGSGVGCSASGNGFDCAQGGSASKDLGTGSKGGTFSWVFQLQIKSGTLWASGDSVKAQYVNSSATKQVALTSQTTTNTIATPEPGSMALLGTALLSAYFLLRRKLQATPPRHGGTEAKTHEF